MKLKRIVTGLLVALFLGWVGWSVFKSNQVPRDNMTKRPNPGPKLPETPTPPTTSRSSEGFVDKAQRALKGPLSHKRPRPDLALRRIPKDQLHSLAKSTRDLPVKDLADPVWQELIAGFTDWQPVFEEDWHCRQKHEELPGSISGCTFEKVLVLERIADGLGQVTRAVAVTGEDPVHNEACVKYADCHANLWTDKVFAMPDNAKSPSVWSEHVMIPPAGSLPATVEDIDRVIEEYKGGLAYFQDAVSSKPELGYKVLFLEDLIGTMNLYKKKVIANDMY